jgi:hypothetical protein
MNHNAHIIDKNDSDKEYICNICSDNIVDDTIIGLNCDPDKHIFCYTCILDWYIILKKKHSNYGNYSILTMCPICRKNGGKLPVCNDVTPINNLHYIKKNKYNGILCGTPLKSNPYKMCCSRGLSKFGGKCGIHKNMENSVLQNSILQNSILQNSVLQNSILQNSVLQDENNKQVNEINDTSNSSQSLSDISSTTVTINLCNTPLKTKFGKLCKSKGLLKYGGKCGLHKNIQITEPLIYPMEEINVI